MRKLLKADAEKVGAKLTPLAFLVKASVAALKEFPDFNASLSPNGQDLVYKKYFHVGFAADTPNGLVVPVIKDAIVFTGYKKLSEQGDATIGASSAQKEEKMDLKLLLVKEIVRKYHGVMKLEVDEKKPRTQISLIFPLERRGVVYYQTSGS